jgi:serine phosphatase RsbU (regulator of sigma subunit)
LKEIGKQMGNVGIMAMASLGKGKALSLKGDHKEAIETHIDLAKLAEAEGEKGFARIFYIEGALDYFRSGSYPNAKKTMDYALTLVNIAHAPPADQFEWEKAAYRIDSAAKYYEGAFRHYYRMNQLKSELKREEVGKALAKERFNSELKIFKSEQEKENVLNAEEKKRQRNILYSVLLFLTFAVGMIVYIFYNLRKTRKANKIIAEQKIEVEKQKHLIEEKQSEILDSIIYAKRLQEAILPPAQFVNKYIPRNFILYKPKDIVAGDFYWAEYIDNKFYIAAADSTGHGVPGAMVSVVCSNALNRTLKEFKFTETGKILDKTRDLVIETFEKSSSEVKDGMDISLLCLDYNTKKAFWSGANNPLWYIHNNELKEIKGDKQPIGKADNPKPFTTHQIDYVENTTFYLFTDGFADQFGGPQGKKFKYKQFFDLLFAIKNQSIQQQMDSINRIFEEWKGNLEQVDDVCVIGIKV